MDSYKDRDFTIAKINHCYKQETTKVLIPHDPLNVFKIKFGFVAHISCYPTYLTSRGVKIGLLEKPADFLKAAQEVHSVQWRKVKQGVVCTVEKSTGRRCTVCTVYSGEKSKVCTTFQLLEHQMNILPPSPLNIMLILW